MFGYLKFLFGANKYNADPLQQQLAELIIESVERRRRANDILTFLHSHDWSRSEQGNRLAHAASMTKVWRPDLFPQVRNLCRDIYAMML